MLGKIEPAPDKLTLHEQFRLIEIAHETADSNVKAEAMSLLARHQMPMVAVFNGVSGPGDSRELP